MIESVSDIKDSFPETNNNNGVCLLVSYILELSDNFGAICCEMLISLLWWSRRLFCFFFVCLIVA